MNYRVAALLGILILIGSIYFAGSGRSISQPAVINITQTQYSSKGLRSGLIRWVYQLYNRRITHAAIGYSTMRCDLIGRGGPLGSGVYECLAIYALDRGKITAQGVMKDRRYYGLAITGGTGIYSNARGSMVANTIGSRPHQERLIFGLEI